MGGTPSAATRLEEGQAGHRFPHFLPDGRRFLFYVAGRPEQAGLFLGSLDTPEIHRLTSADSSGAFLAPDWVLFVQRGSLIARHLDLERHELTGDPVIVANRTSSDGLGAGAFSVSSAGHVAFRGNGTPFSQLAWRDRSGALLELAADPDPVGLAFPEISPDSRQVAAQRIIDGNWDVWSLDLQRGGWAPLRRSAANEQLPLWSPESTRIAFSSNRSGNLNLYIGDVRAGAANDELVVESANPKQPQSWSADGRFLLYYEIDPTTRRDLWALDVTNLDKRPVANSEFEERGGQFSPDGRWVAYETDASGRFEVVVQSFPEPTTVSPVSIGGGTQPRWSADGSEIYFLSPVQSLTATPFTVDPAVAEEPRIGTPVQLFPASLVGNALAAVVRAQYAVSRDGRFLMNERIEASAGDTITLIVNWSQQSEP